MSELELAHVADNKLSVIMAMCDKLREQAADPQVVEGLLVIHMAAQALANEFKKPVSR